MPICWHVVKPEQQRVQTQNLAALGCIAFREVNVSSGQLTRKAWEAHSLHAHHFTATGFSGKSRPRRLKIAAPSGCKSRVADQPSPAALRLGCRRVVNRE